MKGTDPGRDFEGSQRVLGGLVGEVARQKDTPRGAAVFIEDGFVVRALLLSWCGNARYDPSYWWSASE